ncbi:carboxymuconolactone decarboxylase family protein [Vibrio mangrovi]|uniref:Carboxymuconolactone decarboxylase family protein n=1 Tax=Vibrio mangrovi TaxID=474394 RepID=A0A1Y6IX63_9VIBR|nr:carboxymuconolactone decarboxylase family protein [Vibrio mangrovi]MDW6004791.1 carboxymuconolactone decarboxylase family protein [Vibrio mangrovi]SMS01082.1 Carboxymuconolactone decarboxylase family protein [Vibrio mangrovi]
MQTDFNDKQQAIIPIAAFTASGEIDKLKTSLNQGLDVGLTVNEIKEVLVQLYAYAGFPRSLNGLGTLMAVLAERQAQGIEDPQGSSASPLPTDQTSLEFGTANQTKLVGQPVSGPLFDFSPEIDYFLKAHLFGDIFQRDVLDWPTRELATIAALANIKGVNSQLQAHYGISLNNGITPAQLQTFVAVMERECGADVAANAQQVLDQLLQK